MSLNPSTVKALIEAQKLNPSALLELYEIDASRLGLTGVLRFFNGSNHLGANIVFQNKVYSAFPVWGTGFEFKLQGELPRPTLQLGNLHGAITALTLQYQDLVGAKVIRHRTFARYLDIQPGVIPPIVTTYESQISVGTIYSLPGAVPANYPYFLTLETGARYRYIPGNSVSLQRIVTVGFVNTVVEEYLTDIIFTAGGTNYLLNGPLWLGPTLPADPAAVITASVLKIINQPALPSNPLVDEGGFDIVDEGGGTILEENKPVLAIAVEDEGGEEVEGEGGEIVEDEGAGDTFPPDVVNSEADPDAEFPPDIYYINRKTAENKVALSFELSSSLDIDGVLIPHRIISANVCVWGYRSAECSFSENIVVANADNTPPPTPILNWIGEFNPDTVYSYGDGIQITREGVRLVYVYVYFSPIIGSLVTPPNEAYWFQDACSLRLTGCRLRFDPNKVSNPLPFGGFPGTSTLPGV